MDVTKINFTEVLPEVKQAIDSATFVTIDAEFTGLSNGPDVTIYDLPKEYYNKYRIGKMDYLLVQVGLCMFFYDQPSQRFTYRAYNFYVFPHSMKSRGPINFLCEASALEFLSSNGFDFNKLIKEGITYLSYVEEKSIREEVENKYKRQHDKVIIPDDYTDIVEQVCRRIGDYLNSDNTEELILEEPHKSFTRKLIYQAAYDMFPDKSFSIETRVMDSKMPCLVIKKGKSKEDLKKEEYNKELEEITASVGFSHVIRHLSESKKLIVGHNMLLDVCHFVNRFYAKLPADYKEFKCLINSIFPKIVDTKYLCTISPLKDLIQSSVLSQMIARLRLDPFHFIEPEPDIAEYSYSFNSKKDHEAGYDAYITGCAFLTMVSYLARGNAPNVYATLAESDVLKPYINRIHLMRLYDNAFINLTGKEVVPVNRNHVFFVTFPQTWVTADIIHLFKPYGNVHVSYCSSVSAWVTLHNETKVEAVMNNLVRKKTASKTPSLLEHQKQYTVISWHQYQQKLNENKKSSDNIESPGCAELVKSLSTKKRHKKDRQIAQQELDNDIQLASNKRIKNTRLQQMDSVNTVVGVELEQNSSTVDVDYTCSRLNFKNDQNSYLTPEARDFLLTDIADSSELEQELNDGDVKNIKKPSNDKLNTRKYLKTLEESVGVDDGNDSKLFQEHDW